VLPKPEKGKKVVAEQLDLVEKLGDEKKLRRDRRLVAGLILITSLVSLAFWGLSRWSEVISSWGNRDTREKLLTKINTEGMEYQVTAKENQKLEWEYKTEDWKESLVDNRTPTVTDISRAITMGTVREEFGSTGDGRGWYKLTVGQGDLIWEIEAVGKEVELGEFIPKYGQVIVNIYRVAAEVGEGGVGQTILDSVPSVK